MARERSITGMCIQGNINQDKIMKSLKSIRIILSIYLLIFIIGITMVCSDYSWLVPVGLSLILVGMLMFLGTFLYYYNRSYYYKAMKRNGGFVIYQKSKLLPFFGWSDIDRYYEGESSNFFESKERAKVVINGLKKQDKL